MSVYELDKRSQKQTRDSFDKFYGQEEENNNNYTETPIRYETHINVTE